MSRPADWRPLRHADPVAGDADEVWRLARRWTDTAHAVETAAASLRAVHSSTTVWRSASGRAFAAQAGRVAAQLGDVRERYAAGGLALLDHARDLRDVQHDADAALRRAQRAHDDLLAAERVLRSAATGRAVQAAATGVPVPADGAERAAHDRADDARRRLAGAERDLQGAEQAWHASAARACAELDALADDGLTDRLDGALDVVEGATAVLSYASAGLGLAAVAVAPIPPFGPPVGVALGTASLAVGAVAAAGTTALWATSRASGRDVAWSTVGPLAGGGAKLLKLAGLPDELAGRDGAGRLVPAPPPSRPAPPPPNRPPAPAGPAAARTGTAPPAGPGAPTAPAPSATATTASGPATPTTAGSSRTRRAAQLGDGVSTADAARTAAGGVAQALADEPRR